MTRASSSAGTRAPADDPVTLETRPRDGAGVGATIVVGDDLDVLVPRQPIPVLILDACIRKVNVSVVVRQVVCARPLGDLLRLTVRPSVTILFASIALMQVTLIVALELVVENDTAHPTALPSQTLLGALVRAIDS